MQQKKKTNCENQTNLKPKRNNKIKHAKIQNKMRNVKSFKHTEK